MAAATAVACSQVQGAPLTPQFSEGNDEHWYYVVFSAGSAAVYDQFAGNSCITRIVERGHEGALFKLEGSPESFRMTSRRGNYVTYKDFVRMSSDPADAASFRLVPSNLPNMSDFWEIEFPEKGDEYNRWNQWGNTGPGVRIGLYTPGESSNALYFIPEEELPDVPKFTQIKEFATTPAVSFTPSHRHTLWYTKPATAESVADPWMEYALPIGNGEFGAMVFGGVAQDRVQFNDKSLWTGNSTSRGCYQNFGNLYIEDTSDMFGSSSDKAVTEYVRSLDLTQAKANATYLSPDGSTRFTREYIASNPDKAVVIRLSADKPGQINVRLRLFNGINEGILAPKYENGEISFSGLLELIHFKAKVKAVNTGGTVTTHADNIEVTGADELMIILTGATTFDQHSPTYTSSVDAMNALVDSRVSAAASKGWDSILSDHIADYTSLFARSELKIGGTANDRATDQIVTRYNNRRAKRDEPCNLMLEELYYTYGRYLLIGCSRGMDTPANLQGLWNHSSSPAWQCDIHSNINVQMNYWPAEITNLSELHMPYLNYIHSMVTEHPQWSEYASRSGQTKGWTCFTQNNIFGHSDYAENYVIANAWYASHLWQHYIYTLDREFLAEKAMPVMLSCTAFWMERLQRDADGTWVAPKEWSPEHGPAEEDATAHAQQIVANLFSTTLRAIEILGEDSGVDDAFKAELQEKYKHLDRGLATETYTGSWGETLNGITNGDLILREWKTSDYTAGENGHRHQSHLMALYPFGAITSES